MTNPVYQTAIEELETVLSPRVVSRSVKEGLNQVGRTPDTVALSDMERILKEQVYRQLQLTMPVTRAKETVTGVLERLREVSARSGEPANGGAPQTTGGAAQTGGLAEQEEELKRLTEALRPFNLYFEWPEVQKLRAQIQLLTAEHEAHREAPALLADATFQLDVVIQKREDQLVLQARDLTNLKEALEELRALGGARVRRLETLVNQVEGAQENRQLATAEVDRAQRIALDLQQAEEPVPNEGRMSSSQADAQSGAPHEAPADPAAGGRVAGLELGTAQRQLEHLEADFKNLLTHDSRLAARLDDLRARAQAGDPVGGELPELRAALTAAKESLRVELTREFEEAAAELSELRREVDRRELEQATKVTLGILTTALPSLTDVEHVRRLAQLAKEQHEELAKGEAAHAEQLQEQHDLIERLESTLLSAPAEDEGHHPDYLKLLDDLKQLKGAQERQTAAPELVSAVRQAEERLARQMAERATELTERRRARLAALLAQLSALPVTDTLRDEHERLRMEAQNLQAELEADEARAALIIDIDSPQTAALEAAASAEAEAATARLEARAAELSADVRGSLKKHATALLHSARELGDERLTGRVQAALDEIAGGGFPALTSIEAALKQELEAERLLQIEELHRLSQQAAQFATDESPPAADLRRALVNAHEELEAGGLSPSLLSAADHLSELTATTAERLGGVPGRLDAALADFDGVAALNSEDVGAVRRILNHLDSQREALPRLSLGLQLQLEASLAHAERLLEKLRGEFAAASRVALGLVEGGVLDGVLATPAEDAPRPDVVAPLEAPPEAPTAAERLSALALREGVMRVTAFGRSGAPRSVAPQGAVTPGGRGDESSEITASLERLQALEAAAAELTPKGATPKTVVVEDSGKTALLVAWAPSGAALLLELSGAHLAAELAQEVEAALPDVDDLP